ncbi:MAG: AAA family ATPase [Betaproteobacteria bacterium]
MTELLDQAALIAALCGVLRERHGAPDVQVLETHISYVLLTGQHAYKIKKAVKLDFLDFSTLALRRFYCQEELRLNRRYAPHLYLAVVAIGGTLETPVIDGAGPAIEYAVKMREFAQDDLASRMLARDQLAPSHIDLLAAMLATFHHSCRRASVASPYGREEGIVQLARDNFAAIGRLPWEPPPAPAEVDGIGQWTEREFAARRSTFGQRRIDGQVRECHGDLHLGNIARIDGELTFFDCLEFSEDFRWVDVMNEVAFLAMDLAAGGRHDFSWRLLNGYLEASGDYAGMAVLRFYVVYRAMVRAKIALLQLAQRGGAVQPELLADYRRHVDVAGRFARPSAPALILMHGLSGSGKTAVSQGLLETLGAVRLRSDVERKRLAGMQTHARSQSPLGGGLYADDVTGATYQRLLALARDIVRAGHAVIIDATFLDQRQRRMFRDCAQQEQAPFAIVSLAAPEAVLRERIGQRARAGHDASEADLAVLDLQLCIQEPFTSDELPAVLFYDATRPLADSASAAALQPLLERLGCSRQGPAN